jgi:hypothetical protein
MTSLNWLMRGVSCLIVADPPGAARQDVPAKRDQCYEQHQVDVVHDLGHGHQIRR